MDVENLFQALESADSPVTMLRQSEKKSYTFPEVPDVFTNWIEEQKACRESAALADQSHHITDLWIRGEEALALLEHVGVNSFTGFDVGNAKQLVACNPDGHLVGDGILCREGPTEYHLTGAPRIHNWVQYHAEIGDFRVTLERDDSSVVRDGPPAVFRYEVQGPAAESIMEEIVDSGSIDLAFFTFGEIDIRGVSVRALRHTMSGEAGFELWGPYDQHERVRSAIVSAGEPYDLRRQGTKAYRTNAVTTGWVEFPLPAIYHDGMDAYQRWLGADSFEANFSIGGSYDSDDITDYYLRPADVGYDRFVSFDHDFVGREALSARRDQAGRSKVTLVWDDADVVDVFASLFRDGPTHKSMDLLDPAWAVGHYDRVERDGQTVGLSFWPAYVYPERAFLSLCTIDEAFAEPGTDVTVVWGESATPPPRKVESHVEKAVTATVAPAPYTRDNR